MVKTLTEPKTTGVPKTSNVGQFVEIRWLAPYSGGVGVKIISYEI
jgi:hypothetical protein